MEAGIWFKFGSEEEVPPGGGAKAEHSASRAVVVPAPVPEKDLVGESQRQEPALSPPLGAGGRIGWSLGTLDRAVWRTRGPREALVEWVSRIYLSWLVIEHFL